MRVEREFEQLSDVGSRERLYRSNPEAQRIVCAATGSPKSRAIGSRTPARASISAERSFGFVTPAGPGPTALFM